MSARIADAWFKARILGWLLRGAFDDCTGHRRRHLSRRPYERGGR